MSELFVVVGCLALIAAIILTIGGSFIFLVWVADKIF
jgi:hypothetical protein